MCGTSPRARFRVVERHDVIAAPFRECGTSLTSPRNFGCVCAPFPCTCTPIGLHCGKRTQVFRGFLGAGDGHVASGETQMLLDGTIARRASGEVPLLFISIGLVVRTLC